MRIFSVPSVFSCSSFLSSKQTLRFRQRFIQFPHFLPPAARIVGASAAFATHNRRDGLNDFAGLNLFGQIGRNGGDEGDRAVGRTAEDDDAVELALERVSDGLEEIAIRRTYLFDDGAS